jgi:hypothetical protein
MILKNCALIFISFVILCLAACGNETATSDTQEQTSERNPAETVQAGEETPSVPVLLYLPGENAIGFTTETALTDGTPEHIVSLLVSEKALPEGSSLLDFVIDGKLQQAKVDMNAVYGQSFGKGTSEEYQLLGCLVNTLLTYFEQEEILLTIEGETLETGHNVYDYPLRIFE